MFWIGSVIALVGGLLSIGLSRDRVRNRYRVIRDYHLDLAAIMLLVAGLIVSALDHLESERSLRELEKSANVIRSLELHLDLNIPTPAKPLTEAGTDVGLQSSVALFAKDKTRYRFVTDFKLVDQQVSERLRKLSFVYQPESPNDIYGRPIDYLRQIDVFACRFGDILKQEQAEFAGPGKLDIRLLLNGVEVVDLRDQEANPQVLLEQQAILPVAAVFQSVPEVYQKRLRERR